MDPGSTLREARRRAGLSQRALAALVHVPQPSIARIESGAVMPRVDTLDRLLAACGLRLGVSAAGDGGIDPSTIDAMLRLSPTDRLRLAAVEVRNLGQLL